MAYWFSVHWKFIFYKSPLDGSSELQTITIWNKICLFCVKTKNNLLGGLLKGFISNHFKWAGTLERMIISVISWWSTWYIGRSNVRQHPHPEDRNVDACSDLTVETGHFIMQLESIKKQSSLGDEYIKKIIFNVCKGFMIDNARSSICAQSKQLFW